MTDTLPPLERKAIASGYAPEAAAAHENLLQTFEAFKDVNDERLSQIERRMSSDVLTTEKLDRINQALDEQKRTIDDLVLKANRPRFGASQAAHEGAAVRKSGFQSYIRSGDTRALDLETKSITSASVEGGFTVPTEVENLIMSLLKDVSPIRAISGVRQVSANVYKKPFSTTGASVGWVGETEARTQTNAPVLSELSFPTMELYAMPAATQTLLDDTAVNIDEWIAEEVRVAFAEQENAAFVSGDGTNTPKGFLAYDKVAEGAWTWGKIGFNITGVAGGFALTDPADDLIDLVYTLKSAYRGNAHWVMNRATQAEIRKIKDADDNYIWRPGETAGQGATLMGFPVTETEDMPDIGTDSYSIAFGDFQRGYLVVDRIGIRVLRDPYSAKPYVLFYTTKRVGGGVQDFDAIKLLKFAAA